MLPGRKQALRPCGFQTATSREPTHERIAQQSSPPGSPQSGVTMDSMYSSTIVPSSPSFSGMDEDTDQIDHGSGIAQTLKDFHSDEDMPRGCGISSEGSLSHQSIRRSVTLQDGWHQSEVRLPAETDCSNADVPQVDGNDSRADEFLDDFARELDHSEPDDDGDSHVGRVTHGWQSNANEGSLEPRARRTDDGDDRAYSYSDTPSLDNSDGESHGRDFGEDESVCGRPLDAHINRTDISSLAGRICLLRPEAREGQGLSSCSRDSLLRNTPTPKYGDCYSASSIQYDEKLRLLPDERSSATVRCRRDVHTQSGPGVRGANDRKSTDVLPDGKGVKRCASEVSRALERRCHPLNSEAPRLVTEEGGKIPLSDLPDEIAQRIAAASVLPRGISKRWQRLQVKAVRDRIVHVLEASAKLPSDVAANIEDAIFELCGRGAGKAYKIKARELSFNLRVGKNYPLRDGMLSGSLSPFDLVRMSSDELAPPSVRRERERIAKKRIREVTSARYSPHHTVTDRFVCPECGHEKTQYRTWRRKAVVDRVRIIVQCLQCRHSWEL